MLRERKKVGEFPALGNREEQSDRPGERGPSGGASFILNLGLVPGSCRKRSSWLCPSDQKELVHLAESQAAWGKDQRLRVPQDKAEL